MPKVLIPTNDRGFAHDLARKQGTDVESVILKTLRECFFRTQKNRTAEQSESLADQLTGYIGAIDSGEFVDGGLQLSEKSGKKFAELLLRKEQRNRT